MESKDNEASSSSEVSDQKLSSHEEQGNNYNSRPRKKKESNINPKNAENQASLKKKTCSPQTSDGETILVRYEGIEKHCSFQTYLSKTLKKSLKKSLDENKQLKKQHEKHLIVKKSGYDV